MSSAPTEFSAISLMARLAPRSPMPLIESRSNCSTYLATSQPLLTVPSTFFFGTRTLSKKVSQNGEEPEISRIGLVETPGVVMSNSRNVMPSCFFAEKSVRVRQKIQSALLA